jgi:hypothetical protein
MIDSSYIGFVEGKMARAVMAAISEYSFMI